MTGLSSLAWSFIGNQGGNQVEPLLVLLVRKNGSVTTAEWHCRNATKPELSLWQWLVADNIGCHNILSHLFNGIILNPITPELKRNYCRAPKMGHWRDVTCEAVKRRGQRESTRFATERTWVQILTSAGLFSTLHYPNSSGSLIRSLVDVLHYWFFYLKNMLGCAAWGKANCPQIEQEKLERGSNLFFGN